MSSASVHPVSVAVAAPDFSVGTDFDVSVGMVGAGAGAEEEFALAT